MKNKINIPQLRNLCFKAKILPDEILDWIQRENLWNLWVPKDYGGLEFSLSKGLQTLKTLAKIDGSLGWTVTLCSGANYFIGNLQEEVAQEIFMKPAKPVCFGGSGATLGNAEKVGDIYVISGKWRYATGAPYLTHFTLNARITEHGKELKAQDGSPRIRSFIVPKKKVKVIDDWGSMGLKGTATHSFEAKNTKVNEKYSFVYDQFYLPQAIFKIPFSVFADLTLWVNYAGMSEHFLEEAKTMQPAKRLKELKAAIMLSDQKISRFSKEIEQNIGMGLDLKPKDLREIHQSACDSVRALSNEIIKIYPLLGIWASREDQPLNQIFRDYFTATQHHIFH